MFELLLEQMLKPKKFDVESVNHLLLECTISSAKKERDILIVYQWFLNNQVTDLTSAPIDHAKISMRHKHMMMRRIFSSSSIVTEEKYELLNRLKDEDKSNWTEQTIAYCKAAIPLADSKKEQYKQYFDD